MPEWNQKNGQKEHGNGNHGQEKESPEGQSQDGMTESEELRKRTGYRKPKKEKSERNLRSYIFTCGC